MGVEHGIAAAEAHLGMDVMRLAEIVQLIEDTDRLWKGHLRAVAAVVAMAAVQVAGLGQVPLEGKGRYPRLVGVGEWALVKARITNQRRIGG
jgi:hypothetical protein